MAETTKQRFVLAFLEGSYIRNTIYAGCLPEVQPYSGVKEFIDICHEKGNLAGPLTGHQASGVSLSLISD